LSDRTREAARARDRKHGIVIARDVVAQAQSDSRADTMKLWILAGSALALLAAHAAYTFTNRHGRRRGALSTDQVSSEWLATAKIHEDQNR
jgi:peptidoglycan/LPS O-acetylase OafA/YrhL